MGEELTFHGYAFQFLLRSMGVFATILPVSALFALAHINNLHVTVHGLFNTMLFDVLGLRKDGEGMGDNGALDGVMKMLITMRADAKAKKDFALSDRIRDQLAAVGITIKDTKEGTTWEHA